MPLTRPEKEINEGTHRLTWIPLALPQEYKIDATTKF